MQDLPTRRTFRARRDLQKEAETLVQGFDAQQPLFAMAVPTTPASPVVPVGQGREASPRAVPATLHRGGLTLGSSPTSSSVLSPA